MPTAGSPVCVCQPRPSASVRWASSTPSRSDQNRRARSGSSAGNSIRASGLSTHKTITLTDHRHGPPCRRGLLGELGHLAYGRLAHNEAGKYAQAIAPGRMTPEAVTLAWRLSFDGPAAASLLAV